VALPPSLKNIYKELERELGIPPAAHGCLQKWAEEGVLLLNTVLTVRQGAPASHRGKGWEKLTDRIITLLDERPEPLVFLLWGSHARAKKELIKNPRHLILESAHPSPLSAHSGFFGCGHFIKANEFLKEPIDWSLE
ncbi:MAG: uracil-DNA glycosylase, partial [Clostridia bacterium]|nr:uracil-DNA glycosylase [Clostridia bacterium]